MSTLLQDYVSSQADRAADRTAVCMGAERLSYADLELRSNQLAHALIEVGIEPGDRVCLLSEKSPPAVVGLLGALKADAMYVPLDVASPVERLQRIVRSAEPRAVLVSARAADLLDAVFGSGAAVVALEPLPELFSPTVAAEELAAAPAERPPSHTTPDQGAHILFTSGSTGDPKGVVVTHASVCAFVDWAVAYFRICPGDRQSGHPPLHFDLSTFDLFGSFAAGAELHLVPPDLLLPAQLAAFIEAEQLTQWFSVPSAMSYMAMNNAVPESGFPTLERVLWCGEVLPPTVLAQWMRRIPQARYTNLYGPTEAAIASSYYAVPAAPAEDAGPIPIGTACPGEELVVLSEEGEEVDAETIGELHIGGVGLSPGYWRDEERTRAAFVPDPRAGSDGQRLYRTGDLARSDGQGLLHFHGRRDSQIKSRGYRIELGEVETAVSHIEGVAECAVVSVSSNGFEGVSICCAFAPGPDADLQPAAVRQALRKKLPGYMQPSRWAVMPRLPKNANGKIDRVAVRAAFESER